MNRPTRVNAWYLVIAMLGVFLLHSLWAQTRTVETIPYSQFETYLDERAVSDVTVGPERIRGTYVKPRDGKTGFVTTPVAPELVARHQGCGRHVFG